MRIYKLINTKADHRDCYQECVVAATSGNKALLIRPDGKTVAEAAKEPQLSMFPDGTWPTNPDDIRVEFVGYAKAGTKSGVLCADFYGC